VTQFPSLFAKNSS